MTTQDMIYGGVVSYQAEGRSAANHYGILDVDAGPPQLPVMHSPGLNASFGVDVEELYTEIPHTPESGNSHILECVRNVQVGENLPFHLEAYPQIGLHFPLLAFITGSVTGLADQPDSTSWMKELDDHWSVFTGVMFEDYKCDIPAIGVAKETISGFAGDKADIVEVTPAATEADMDASAPYTWGDVISIKMGAAGETDIADCVSDISFGFASEVSKFTHPESLLSTKICGVRVVSRKMYVSLKLTWTTEEFRAIVTTPSKQILKLVLGPAGDDQFNITFGGLYFPKYVAKAEAKTVAGDTITAIVDQPTCVYSFGA